MSRTVVELARVALSDSITLVAQEVTTNYSHRDTPYVYKTHDLEGLGGGVEGLSQLAHILTHLPEDGALELNQDELEELLKDWARDLAEDAELPFTFEDSNGRTQTYQPQSLWEASGSCSEWEQSAQEGYDYGWNV